MSDRSLDPVRDQEACPDCGALVLNPGDRFCELCGSPLLRVPLAEKPITVTRKRLGGHSETVVASTHTTPAAADGAMPFAGVDATVAEVPERGAVYRSRRWRFGRRRRRFLITF